MKLQAKQSKLEYVVKYRDTSRYKQIRRYMSRTQSV